MYLFTHVALAIGLCAALPLSLGCGTEQGSSRSDSAVPAEYAGKHMPRGWWSDPSITKEGQRIYLGLEDRDVNCAQCHGRAGKPVKAGARDLGDSKAMKKYSDSHLFWRISEGIPFTQMRGYKDKLTEEQIWKVIAYTGTFGLKGLRYDPALQQWVPASATQGNNTDPTAS